MSTRALVLAGGGVAGIAWELGVLLGLRDSAPDLFPALLRPDLTVGTSAGAAVAGQLGSDLDLEALYDRQFVEPSGEISVELDIAEMMPYWQQVLGDGPSPIEARRRLGALALDASKVAEADRLAVIRHRLPSHEWPAHRLILTAVDCSDGELILFDSTSGVSLVDAVAASCAVPLIWPAVTIGDKRYMDGGMASPANTDVAADCDQIVLLSPTPIGAPALLGEGLQVEVDRVGPSKIFVIDADAQSLAAFGTNPLDPATRGPSATAGRALGRSRGEALAAFLAL